MHFNSQPNVIVIWDTATPERDLENWNQFRQSYRARVQELIKDYREVQGLTTQICKQTGTVEFIVAGVSHLLPLELPQEPSWALWRETRLVLEQANQDVSILLQHNRGVS